MRALRSCWLSLGTGGALLFMVGLALVYPWLLIPTIVVIVLVGIAVINNITRRSKP